MSLSFTGKDAYHFELTPTKGNTISQETTGKTSETKDEAKQPVELIEEELAQARGGLQQAQGGPQTLDKKKVGTPTPGWRLDDSDDVDVT